MSHPILAINAGSSSIKFSVFDTLADRSLAARVHGHVEGIGESPRLEIAGPSGQPLANQPVVCMNHEGAIAAINEWFTGQVGSEGVFDGVGHRVVHGGLIYSQPVLIDDRVLADLESLVPLAPLHEPHHIAAIRAVRAIAPRVPQVACFDTAFHRSQPPIAQQFALPRDLTAKGVLRYGFHGLSYEYIMSVMPHVAPACANRKLIVAHLGNGASMCAIEAGRSIATTMSFTALDGLPMGTRTGALDPAVILYLLQHERLDVDAIQRLMWEQSGLLGVSGLSNDMRTLLASGLPAAMEAVDLFVYRIGRELGSLVAALGGLDALVFTAGIGEHAAEIRARVCKNAQWIGIALDEKANADGGPRISRSDSRVSAWVIPTDEDLVIARYTRQLVDCNPPH